MLQLLLLLLDNSLFEAVGSLLFVQEVLFDSRGLVRLAVVLLLPDRETLINELDDKANHHESCRQKRQEPRHIPPLAAAHNDQEVAIPRLDHELLVVQLGDEVAVDAPGRHLRRVVDRQALTRLVWPPLVHPKDVRVGERDTALPIGGEGGFLEQEHVHLLEAGTFTIHLHSDEVKHREQRLHLHLRDNRAQRLTPRTWCVRYLPL
mmetsp:Transcript_22165/g.53165  ORF Transcript_22165/g.53165 Transcript_22165/m.53165 type:complete len:206 (-) Transcript_22165:717-1334(-)